MMKEKKLTALLVGGSGLIGSELLPLLLQAEEYEKVILLVRRSIGISHPKLQEEVINFDDFKLRKMRIDHAFCTLGTTIKVAGSKENFRKVDEEYPLKIAKYCLENGAQLFEIVTAMAADAKSMVFYNRVKGNVENGLLEMGFKHLAIFRPSMLSGDRKESRTGEKIGLFLMNWIGFLIPENYKVIHVKQVAQSMLNYAKKPKMGSSIILSGQIKSIPLQL